MSIYYNNAHIHIKKCAKLIVLAQARNLKIEKAWKNLINEYKKEKAFNKVFID